MKGDREQCIDAGDAGMDGYVSKPIRPEEFSEAIDRLVAHSDPPSARTTHSNPMGQVFERSALLSQFGGDLELLQRVVSMFLQDATELLSSISDSIARRDSRSLEHAAHKLKGCVANFHAGAAVQAAQRLENIGRGRDLGEAQHALAELENEMRRLEPALATLGGDCARRSESGLQCAVDEKTGRSDSGL